MAVAIRLFGELMDEQLDVLDRVVRALERARADWALVGGHAVSAHVRPRLTVDVDFLVEGRRREAVERALGDTGYTLRHDVDAVRVLRGPDDAEPVADLLFSDLHALWAEALHSASEVTYQGRTVRVVSRPALVAMKYLAAVSPRRSVPERYQDVTDIALLVTRGWTPQEAAETERLARLGHAGAAGELARLVDDLRAGRPVTI